MEADYVLDYDVIAGARQQSLYVLARIKGSRPADLSERRPLNISVVLDRSGSMAGDKLEYVKQAAEFLMRRLGAEDLFSLVTYDNEVRVEFAPAAPVHKDAISAAIRRITSGNTTNLSGGWMQGCQLVAEHMVAGQVNRVLLLTDGLANQGITDAVRLEALARSKRGEGITTTTMGVGMGFNEDLLTRMAAEGGGAFYFIDSPDVAPQLFSEELQGLLNVIGQNLTITLTVSPPVRFVRQLHAYPARPDGPRLTFSLGDLYADELKLLLLEFFIPGLPQLGQVEVARLRFEYDELGAETVTHRSLELPIVVNAVAEEQAAGQTPHAEVVREVLLLGAARAREQAVEHADRGEFEQASSVLKQAADAIEDSGMADERLKTEHDMLREEASDMEMGARRYDSYARKAHQSKAHYASTAARASAPMSHELHRRMKASREAIERGGPAPQRVRWWSGEFDLTAASMVRIGSAADNDIVLDEDGVAPHHCTIRRVGSMLVLEDLGSSAGTFANGGLLDGPFRLSAGDVVTVGMALLRFE